MEITAKLISFLLTLLLVTLFFLTGCTVKNTVNKKDGNTVSPTEGSKTEIELYVSTLGNDKWSGELEEPNADGSDGPFASIERARDVVRKLNSDGKSFIKATVWIRGGIYNIEQPIVFLQEDSGDITYAAYPGEQPLISGGRLVTDWKSGEFNGKVVWTCHLPEVEKGEWYFRQLFVNGERRERPRLPKKDFYWMEDVPDNRLDKKYNHPGEALFDGSDNFKCAEGDIQNWKNLNDVEVVLLHYWIEERMPILEFDEATGMIKSSRESAFSLRDDWAARYAKYYVDNVFEALTEPGEWYLDRQTGMLFYIPMPEESLDNIEIIAPIANQLVKFQGNPEEGKYVEGIKFKGIEFAYTDWYQPDLYGLRGDGSINYAATYQGAVNIPGIIAMKGARNCAVENSIIRNIGWYGIDLAEGCMGNLIVGNEIYDMGAGGIKVYGAGANVPESYSSRTGGNAITDNHIHDGGKVFYSGEGIIVIDSFDNNISHNHIHDLYYTGISCGWVWGYGDNISKNNRITKNHIHDIGKGILNDMGGIYTLGIQPGTVISGNIIHDIESSNYGGWAIYTDEGSSYIVIENNICYNTSNQVYNHHYGKENIVRNNIFAFGRAGIVSNGKSESHNQFTFQNNILISNNGLFFVGSCANKLGVTNIKSDLNLLWTTDGREIINAEGIHIKEGSGGIGKKEVIPLLPLSLSEWNQLGYDNHSIIADPLCKDVLNFDFTLEGDSPAFQLGFTKIYIGDVGPRPEASRTALFVK